MVRSHFERGRVYRPQVELLERRNLLDNSALSSAYGHIPLSFEANQGQTDPAVQFLSRGSGYALFLTSQEAVLSLSKPVTPAATVGPAAVQPAQAEDVLCLQLVGANPAPQVAGVDPLPGTTNYFIGNDPAQWRTNIATYGKVAYQDVYPGVDLVYYGNQQQLEYDFVLQPGANPGVIRLSCQGAQNVTLDAQGNLVLQTADGDVVEQAPVVYQDGAGGRQAVAGRYVLLGPDGVGFQVGGYDASRPLIIDPVLSYATYLGGSGADSGSSIAVDASGSVYVTGSTSSLDFPTTPGALQTTADGGYDAFVAKLNTTGTALVYSTYLGGNGDDYGYGIAVDASGNAYVTGSTSSWDFPITPGALQPSNSSEYYITDAFVAKLNATGTALLYATYLGGTNNDCGYGIAVDGSGNAYVTGSTSSWNFPITPGALQPTSGSDYYFTDAFVAKLNAMGTALLYSTYLGGNGDDSGYGIAVDASGNAYVTGSTSSLNFPTTPGALQTTLDGSGNAFVAEIAFATVTTVLPSVNPSVYGQPVTFTATVMCGGSPVNTGTVTFQEGNTVLASGVPVNSGGQASFQISTLTAAGSPHTITAYYSDSAGSNPSSGSVIQTVNKAPLIVMAPLVTRSYGAANPALTGAIVGIANGDPITATYATAATPASPIGSYAIVPTLSDRGTGKLSNYTPTIYNGTLTITPALLSVTPANATREFGTANLLLTGTITGIQNGDNITASYSTTATLTSPVGTYPITATLLDPNKKLSNYTVTVSQGVLTITPDPLLVTTTADSGPGSLRAILAAAPADSAVHFWSGVQGIITLTSGPLSLTEDVTIAGPGAGVLTVSGNKTSQVLVIAPAITVSLSGLTIANGSITAGYGGGIENQGTLTVTSCTITGNYASPRGGGIHNGPTGILTINNSLVSGNTTTNAGGGIFNEGALTIDASTFTSNGGTNPDGGAIFNFGTVTLWSSTFSNNGGTGAYGGAVRNDGLTTIQECTFASNRANLGGALYNVGTLIVSSSTLSLNTAVAGGGGIDNGGALLARDTIVAGNTITSGTGPDLYGVLTSRGHNLIGTTQGGSGYISSDLLNVKPLLGPLQNNGGPTQTMALLSGSPAIGAGDPTDAPAYDQRGPGYPRLVNGKIDIGAFEVQPTGASEIRLGAPAPARDAIGYPVNGSLGTVALRFSDPAWGVILPTTDPFAAITATPFLASTVPTILRSSVDLLGGRATQQGEPFAVLGAAEAVDQLFADGYYRFGEVA
jgi:hypothetical protein